MPNSHQSWSASRAAPTPSAIQRTGEGANPTPALHELLTVVPIPHKFAKRIVERHHYLHSMPGGTEHCFGVIAGRSLAGAVTLGVGPANAYRLMDGAKRSDCVTLSRLWLSDDLPRNSESRVIGFVLRLLRRETDLKFVVSYADPAKGHLGGIYKATNWLYTGLSEPSPMLDFGDGVERHSRSVAHNHGTHSLRFFAERGLKVRKVPHPGKHRYLYLLDPSCRSRLTCSVMAYPKPEETSHECD